VTVIEESDELHARVRAFAAGQGHEAFETLALDIARFQARRSPGYGRLVEARGSALDRVESIPAVPTDAFRLARVAVHPRELDVARFVTSGTTSELGGVHVMRTTETYRALALASGRAALCSAFAGPRVVVALAPRQPSSPTSSLGFMMRTFIEAFDGRALSSDPMGTQFDADADGRWLLGPSGVDIDGLQRAARLACERGEPLLLLATALALAALLDALDGAIVRVPSHSVVMVTGGFKGKNRAISPERLHNDVARMFDIELYQVVGEYGMTELTSQLYEGTLPGGALVGAHGVFLEPTWLRVTPVDPISLEPLSDGMVGIARMVDLGNVDSAVAVLTQDLVCRRMDGIELCGRQRHAEPRGCSLAIEPLLVPSGTSP
jgi:hypothetical protein